MEMLNDKKLCILDMDGTIYIENQLVEGAVDFLLSLNKKGIDYVFLSNNSSINNNDYVLKLRDLGIPCNKDNIYSSGMATAMYLSRNRKGKTVFLVGTRALLNEFVNAGIKVVDNNPDILVVGFDRELSYDKIEKACRFLEEGVEFIATNPDLVYPIKNARYIPDCGSICYMLTTATKRIPFFIGKPNPYIIDIVLENRNIPKSSVVLIGDRLYTDIAAGINAGIYTVLVLSGETNEEMLAASNFKPDLVIASVKNLL